MVGIDTNVLLRWLAADPDDDTEAARQVRAVEEAVAGAAGGCFVNAVVLAEVIWVAVNRFRLPKEVIVDLLRRLVTSRNVSLGDSKAVEAALERYARGVGGGFVDHLIGALNATAACSTTLTFDRKAARSDHFTLLT